MSAHTPGPWQAKPEMLSRDFHIAGRSPTVVKGDNEIASVARPPRSGAGRSEEAEANAHLIAAAPELYREAIQVVEWLDRLAARADENAKDTRFQSLADANAADAKNYRASAKGLRAAIAKAEGRS